MSLRSRCDPPYSEKIFRTDITNYQNVSEIFQNVGPDKVIHLAAQIQVNTALDTYSSSQYRRYSKHI